MKAPLSLIPSLVTSLGVLLGSASAAEPPLREQAIAGMKRAAEFYRAKASAHGGYVYYTSLDLRQRWGEGAATADQIFIQPPGTPAVGMAFLKAHTATGDKFYLDAARAAVEALVFGQLQSGGWAQVIDFDPRGAKAGQYRNGKARGRNHSTFDDGISQSALRFLMHADQALGFKHAGIHEAIETLLQVHRVTGDAKYLEPIPRALAWLKRSRLPDGRLARYYELRNNKPLYMTSDYQLTNSDADVPQHYGWKTEAQIEKLEKAVAAAKDGKAKAPQPKVPTEAAVRQILRDLDAQGRWVSTATEGMKLVGQPKFAPGFQFLASEVFNKNLEMLADFVAAAKP